MAKLIPLAEILIQTEEITVTGDNHCFVIAINLPVGSIEHDIGVDVAFDFDRAVIVFAGKIYLALQTRVL